MGLWSKEFGFVDFGDYDAICNNCIAKKRVKAHEQKDQKKKEKRVEAGMTT